MQNVIQLKNAIAILVDDHEFVKAQKQYNSLFRRHIKVVDTRGREFLFRKKYILLLEKRNKYEKIEEKR